MKPIRAELASFKPSVEQVDPGQAQVLWAQSPDATPFTNPQVLAALSAQVSFWCARVADEALCIWPVCRSADGVVCAPEFSYYVGPIWAASVHSGSQRQRLYKRLAAIDGLCSAIVGAHGGFEIELSPGDADIRPYRWWAQKRGDPGALQVEIEYTAQLDLCAITDAEALQRGFSTDRRTDVRRWSREGAPATCAWKVDDVLRLYRELSDRLGDRGIYQRRERELIALCALVESGHGFVEACGFDPGAPPAALKLVLVGGGFACAVLSLAQAHARAARIVPWINWRTLEHSRRTGVRIHDFNGANSLLRGSDALSYGAQVLPYLRVRYWPDQAPRSGP